MRDPDRIDPMIERLRAAWKAYPDLRLTQLVWCLAKPQISAPEFFYKEDDALDWSIVEPREHR